MSRSHPCSAEPSGRPARPCAGPAMSDPRPAISTARCRRCVDAASAARRRIVWPTFASPASLLIRNRLGCMVSRTPWPAQTTRAGCATQRKPHARTAFIAENLPTHLWPVRSQSLRRCFRAVRDDGARSRAPPMRKPCRPRAAPAPSGRNHASRALNRLHPPTRLPRLSKSTRSRSTNCGPPRGELSASHAWVSSSTWPCQSATAICSGAIRREAKCWL